MRNIANAFLQFVHRLRGVAKPAFCLLLLMASAGAATSARAVGTPAGTSIADEVTVTYSLNGGATQEIVNVDAVFTVDRKVDLLVLADNTAPVAVMPGQTGSNIGANAAATAFKFTVTNKSNATLDFELVAADDNNAVTLGGTSYTDSANATSYAYYYADNGGNFSASSAQVPTDTNGRPFIDNLAADDAKVIYVVAAVPAGTTNGSIINVSLKATAVEPADDSALIDQAGINKNDVANLANMLTLFADNAGIVDGVKDAAYSAAGVFLVAQSQTTLVKAATVKDPWGGASVVQNAIVTYTLTFTASVTSGGSTLATPAVQDFIPVGTTYQQNSITLDGAAVTDNAGYFNAGSAQCAGTQPCINVSLSPSNITLDTATPSVSHIVTFQVKVN